ncbi:helix-turn-helix domain-containing protein [Kordia sp.]|uniref:helix-turn-helix domain-containing protein n=1 Tax=Kordia sp. TaxID=1965332 RepID=UPI003D2ABF5D
MIGEYFYAQNKIDSAAVYFYKAVDALNQEISYPRQRDYFYMAWYTASNLKKYGECIVIADKFKSLINESSDYTSLAIYYFFCENIFLETKDYDLALDNNQLRIQAVRRTRDTINVIGAKMVRAQIRYHYFNDLNGAFEIMNELIDQVDGLPYGYRKSIYGEYGIYMFYKKEYDQALNFYLKGLENLRKSEDSIRTNTSFAIAYGNIAEAFLELGKYEDAQKYIDSIYAIGINNIDRSLQNTVLKYQLRVSSLTNSEPKIVLQSIDSIFKYMDLQYEEKFTKELEALKTSQASEQLLLKTSEKYKSKNRAITRLVYLLVATLLVLSLIVWLVYKNIKIKSKLRHWVLLNLKEENISKQNAAEIEQYLSISIDVINKIREQLENFENTKEFLSEKIQLRQLAKKFGTNYTYLSKVINMDKDKNFSQYINDLRLDFAFNEMASNPVYKRYTIKAIAQQCGFKNAGGFSRKFYNKYGQYPSDILKS